MELRSLKVERIQILTQISINHLSNSYSIGLGGRWSKAHVSCVLPPGYQGFEPWFQLELESDWKLPRRDCPFKASSGCK